MAGDSLFTDEETNYSLFFDKKVFGIDELIQQNRTVWFLRRFKPGDKENEIILLNANVVQPCIYSQKYHELSGNTFLWLSDLHFSNNVLSVKETTNTTSLTRHIIGSVGEWVNDISALIISGDISDCCKEEGFENAEAFISDLNREINCKLDSDNIIVCPGNHDLKRKESNVSADDEPKLFLEDADTASRKKVIRTRLKRHNFGIFWLVIFARRQPCFIFRTKICSKFYSFQVEEF